MTSSIILLPLWHKDSDTVNSESSNGITYDDPTAQCSDRTLWGIRQYFHQQLRTKWEDDNTGRTLRWAIDCQTAGALMDWLKSIHEAYGIWTESKKGRWYWKLDAKLENGANGLRIIAEYGESLLQVFPDLRPVAKVAASVANSTPTPVILAPPTFGTPEAQTVTPTEVNGPVVIVQPKQRKAPKEQPSTVNTSMREAAKREAAKVKAANAAKLKPTGTPAPTTTPANSYIMIQ